MTQESQQAPQDQAPSHDSGDIFFDLNQQVDALAKAQESAELDEAEEELSEEPSDDAPAEPEKGAEVEAEEPPAPPVPKVKVDKDTDQRIANLHRREQDLLAKSDALKAKEAEFREYQAAKARAKQSPFEFLKMVDPENFGGPDGPEKFLNWVAETGGKMTPEQVQLQELQAKLAEREAREKEWEAQAQQRELEAQRTQALDKAHKDIVTYIKDTPSLSKTLAAVPGSERRVYQIMQAHYDETQEELPVDKAVERVGKELEGYLRDIMREALSSEHGARVVEEELAKLKPARAGKVRSAPFSTNKTTAQAGEPAKPRSRVEEFDSELDRLAKAASLAQKRAQGR